MFLNRFSLIMQSFNHLSTFRLSLLALTLFFCLQRSSVLGSPTPLLGDITIRDYYTNPFRLISKDRKIIVPPLEPRHLHRRQCVQSNQKNKNGNFKWACDGKPVSLLEIHDNIDSTNYAAGRVTMFYTKLGQPSRVAERRISIEQPLTITATLGGANGVKQSKCWANNHPNWIAPKNDQNDKAGFVMPTINCENGRELIFCLSPSGTSCSTVSAITNGVRRSSKTTTTTKET